MNALERKNRALSFRASKNVTGSLDFTRHPEVEKFVPRYEKCINPQSTTDTISHGVCLPKENIEYTTTLEFSEFKQMSQPTIDKPTTQYMDLSQHPECRPTYKPPAICEVAQTINNYNNVDKEDKHQHPLIHQIHTQYTGVGETVKRNYQSDNFTADKLMGCSTVKQASDRVEGVLEGVYYDKGYTVRRLEIPEKDIKRDIGHFYSCAIPDDKSKYDPAGVKITKSEGVSDIFKTNYGQQSGAYNETMKVTVNDKNDVTFSHGYKPSKKDQKPGYLGGQRAGGDMENYQRQQH